MKRMLLWSALLGAALAYGTGCGDGGTTGSAGSAGTSGSAGTGGSSGSSGSSGGGTGGTMTTGGAGGTMTTGGTGGTMTTGGSAGSMSGSGGAMSGSGSGGSMGGNLLNGCDPMAAEDHTADAVTTVNQMGLAYTPKCIKIKAGSSVKFTSTFMFHPLLGGVVESGVKTPDANSPIKSTSSGTEATFMFPKAGSYGYYCDVHALMGMTGAIFVE